MLWLVRKEKVGAIVYVVHSVVLALSGRTRLPSPGNRGCRLSLSSSVMGELITKGQRLLLLPLPFPPAPFPRSPAPAKCQTLLLFSSSPSSLVSVVSSFTILKTMTLFFLGGGGGGGLKHFRKQKLWRLR